MIAKLENYYGRILAALFAVGCIMIFMMLATIVGDVLLRNVRLPGLPRGISWSNEVSESLLYLTTMFVAPWLLRQGQHIRVDIVLQALPARFAWFLEWVGDLVGFACCLFMSIYGAHAAWRSFQDGAMNIKTLETPEWWSLAPLPAIFALLSLEMIFRMGRLYRSERSPRSDAVSAS